MRVESRRAYLKSRAARLVLYMKVVQGDPESTLLMGAESTLSGPVQNSECHLLINEVVRR